MRQPKQKHYKDTFWLNRRGQYVVIRLEPSSEIKLSQTHEPMRGLHFICRVDFNKSFYRHVEYYVPYGPSLHVQGEGAKLFKKMQQEVIDSKKLTRYIGGIEYPMLPTPFISKYEAFFLRDYAEGDEELVAAHNKQILEPKRAGLEV